MTLHHIQPSRRTVRSLAVFISLALLALILAACSGAQPTATPIQAPAAATQPTAAPTQTPAATQAKPAAPAPTGNLTQSAEAGAVTVDITPLNLGDAKASTLDFKVVMDTHSVELGGDLAKLAVLKIGDNEVTTKLWQAPAGGGHHVREGSDDDVFVRSEVDIQSDQIGGDHGHCSNSRFEGVWRSESSVRRGRRVRAWFREFRHSRSPQPVCRCAQLSMGRRRGTATHRVVVRETSETDVRAVGAKWVH